MSERASCLEHDHFHGTCADCQRERAMEAEARVKGLEKWRDAVYRIIDSLDDPYGDFWYKTSQEDCARELEWMRSILVPLVENDNA